MTSSFITNNEHRLAYVNTTFPDNGNPHVLFCGGFNSSMQGTKAMALEAFCLQHDIAFTRFDYSGHGSSEGDFTEGDIGAWLSDALCIFDTVTRDKQNKTIVIGSSMGAWIATLLSIQRKDKIAGLLTIAAAPDFTEKLLLASLNEHQRNELSAGKTIQLASDYDDGSPYPISANLIEQSRNYCILNKPIDLDIPVRMLHGTEDQDVPYALSEQLMQVIQSNDSQLTLIKNADHRLSTDTDLRTINTTLKSLIDIYQAKQ